MNKTFTSKQGKGALLMKTDHREVSHLNSIRNARSFRSHIKPITSSLPLANSIPKANHIREKSESLAIDSGKRMQPLWEVGYPFT